MTTQYQIFVDMDGVITDFDTLAKKITGMSSTHTMTSKEKRFFWMKINQHVKNGHSFHGVMDLLPDAMELWNYVLPYNPRICSSYGNTVNADIEKLEWIETHLGEAHCKPTILVKSSKEKANYASPTSILIDDRAVSIDPWIAAGGIGILHKSAKTTIEKLKELGL